MVQHLVAVQFIRFMASGRTSPALFNCENEFGAAAGDFVVKLRGSVLKSGLLKELIGSNLASYFGLSVPEPAFVTVGRELADLIAAADPSKASIVNGSVGINFGSKEAIGFSTWPVDRRIPDSIWQTAVEIFAFDALVQNPDRRYGNPNLMVNGDGVLLFDHELAFSFLDDVVQPDHSWRLDRQAYLRDHVFFRQLKSHAVDLNEFTLKLAGLSGAVLESLIAEAPPEWNNEDAHRIAAHLGGIRGRAEEFALEVRRFLA